MYTGSEYTCVQCIQVQRTPVLSVYRFRVHLCPVYTGSEYTCVECIKVQSTPVPSVYRYVECIQVKCTPVFSVCRFSIHLCSVYTGSVYTCGHCIQVHFIVLQKLTMWDWLLYSDGRKASWPTSKKNRHL